jgi:Cupin-like domain
MTGSEFAARCSASDSTTERVYMQTIARPSERVIAPLHQRGLVDAAQDERVWVSTHGAVSTLHYDASHSVLAQCVGRKRILFFPPSCLKVLGIYPKGHPLHRRSRVDLTASRNSAAARGLFADFWNAVREDSIAIEALLNPGDVITFPPFWSHYAITTSPWSVSHTFRF